MPDLNEDGVIEANEYVKVCPCFDVKEFLKSGRESLVCMVGGFNDSFFWLGVQR